MSKTYSLDELNLCSAQAFVDVLGGIFEHSPWVAEQLSRSGHLPVRRPYTRRWRMPSELRRKVRN
jgi:2-oxo-4-hydroxy-4-carboxy--5-ureidoimidazoline (OHCU) decarboxylase